MSFDAQYVGFTPKLVTREYNFVVRAAPVEMLEITFAISNKAFTSRRLSFQNAPDLCSLKLHREMASSLPLKSHYQISEGELDDYRDSHESKPRKNVPNTSQRCVSNRARLPRF
jgi:hypothetical protein